MTSSYLPQEPNEIQPASSATPFSPSRSEAGQAPIKPSQTTPQPKRSRTGLIVATVAAGVATLIGGATISAVLLTPASSKTDTTAAAAPTSTAAPGAPAETRASVQQYAGAVNPSIKSLHETWQTYRTNTCAVDGSSFVCSMTSLTLNTEAQTLVAVLNGAAKPGVPAYIGKPPAELEKLVADTMTAAQAVAQSVGADGKASPQTFLAVSRLMTVLDRWDPYI